MHRRRLQASLHLPEKEGALEGVLLSQTNRQAVGYVSQEEKLPVGSGGLILDWQIHQKRGCFHLSSGLVYRLLSFAQHLNGCAARARFCPQRETG